MGKKRWNVNDFSCSLGGTYSALNYVSRLVRSKLTFPGSHDKYDGDSEGERETVLPSLLATVHLRGVPGRSGEI